MQTFTPLLQNLNPWADSPRCGVGCSVPFEYPDMLGQTYTYAHFVGLVRAAVARSATLGRRSVGRRWCTNGEGKGVVRVRHLNLGRDCDHIPIDLSTAHASQPLACVVSSTGQRILSREGQRRYVTSRCTSKTPAAPLPSLRPRFSSGRAGWRGASGQEILSDARCATLMESFSRRRCPRYMLVHQ